MRTCDIDGCGRKHYARGFCGLHYQRVLAHGTPGEPQRRRELAPERVCSVPGCEKPHNAKGMCGMHYNRWRDDGDPGEVGPRQGPKGAGSVDRSGYRMRQIGGRRILEHRLVMEQTLGRRLMRSESVHHINGDRADNRIENLELWSKSQPPGQRVADKVAWAKEILALYGE